MKKLPPLTSERKNIGDVSSRNAGALPIEENNKENNLKNNNVLLGNKFSQQSLKTTHSDFVFVDIEDDVWIYIITKKIFTFHNLIG